jgi:hypothetical protein
VAISFGNQPIAKQVSDVSAQSLPASYFDGTVALTATAFEADVAPRPNGDGVLTINDWVQIGRFVAGMDTVSAAEFQRVDCAPRSTLGDGRLTLSDWVQAGRYASGMDPATPVGGPASPVGPDKAATAEPKVASTRALGVPSTNVPPGGTLVLPVRLTAEGNENALAFSVDFDATRMKFTGSSIASGMAGANPLMNVNTNQAATGRIGVVFALPAGSTFTEGGHDVILFSFKAVTNATGSSAITLTDGPIAREIDDALAEPLATTYGTGTVSFVAPALRAIIASGQFVISWPDSDGFVLQSAASVTGPWTTVTTAAQTVGGAKVVTTPIATTGQKYFRLLRQ